MNLPRKRLAILKTGDTLDEVKAHAGDFDAMITKALEGLPLETRVVAVHRGETPPPLEGFDLLMVTGSPHSVTAREPWADALAEALAGAVASGAWILGICYGHQLLAHALGGRVERNPSGYEVGTVEVDLTDAGRADPVLGAVSGGASRLPFHSTHLDAVVALPPGAHLLASSPLTEVQAFSVGERVLAVQFHPEFDEEIIRRYVAKRTPLIESEAQRKGLDPRGEVERARASITPSPAGRALLRRFVERAGPR